MRIPHMRIPRPPVPSLPLAAACAAVLLAASALPATATAASPPSLREGTVGAAELLAKVTSCTRISQGEYRTDEEARATVPVCGTDGAVFWKADMDIDCDGQRTARCNENTDPWFQPDTAFHQSDGRPLRSDSLPYVVVPSVSETWSYPSAGIGGGGVVAVIHDGKVQYAVVGDTGPKRIIGEASYATAEALGIDPDPATGGTDAEVTYILFPHSRVSPIENHDAAVALGDRLAREFVRGD
ncbi:glycoside hydrolase family 75 protein [Streptomyces sp. YU58]|uniref:glycoside hydrolase family 75 protein n=1 Tax=Streptomyces sp. SX92 TaxID=3158972 RepID=UPI0027BA5E37|nr:glycoside hydrolase family 75 protein [Streptomyces coralus]WLW51014.1 glycoside hydrolase family 75 protein [Streptomyces coralus]